MDMMTALRRLLGITLFLLALAGCAGKSTVQDDAVVAGGISHGANREYIIGPGDTLQIFVWRNSDISTTVPVRPDGRISTPLVKEMLAVGKTPNQLGQDIEEVLSKYIKGPEVTVIVTGFVGTFSEQIRVVGQAAKPMALSYRENITLLDVMIEVGGLNEFAAGNRAKIIRKIGGKQTEIMVRLEDLIKDGDITANVFMHPGDVLIIPESWL